MTDRWKPGSEVLVFYDPAEYDLYRIRDPSCRYHQVRWPLEGGRAKHGEFPLVIVREHYRSLGYSVLASEPRLPKKEGFIVASYPGKRREGDPAYQRMEAMSGAKTLADLNRRADEAKRAVTGNAGGGDPDLFVYRADNPSDRFFVEVKHRDQLKENQLITIPYLEELCPVIVVRLVESS